jgi:zinc-ribbon domain
MGHVPREQLRSSAHGSDLPSDSGGRLQCPRCQQDNPTGQKFCGQCGTPLQHSSDDVTKDRSRHSLLLPEVPIERLSSEDDEDEVLESTRRFPGQRLGTLIPKLVGVLSGVALAALVLSLAGQSIGQSLGSLLFKEPLSGGPGERPGQTKVSFTPAQSPVVTKKPDVFETRPAGTATSPPARPNNEAPSTGGRQSTKSVSPRDADRLTPRQRETSHPPEVTGTASRQSSTTSNETSTPTTDTSARPRGANTPANETGGLPNAGTSQGASGGRLGLSATVQPNPSAPAPSQQVATAPMPEAGTPKATPQFGGSHAELVRQPVSRGWGDSYAVRLLDPAGKPIVVPDVLLVAHMADGTVENVPMGALPEPGTYRGTVPTGRSTPVGLRVRVRTGDKFVEVLVKP